MEGTLNGGKSAVTLIKRVNYSAPRYDNEEKQTTLIDTFNINKKVNSIHIIAKSVGSISTSVRYTLTTLSKFIITDGTNEIVICGCSNGGYDINYAFQKTLSVIITIDYVNNKTYMCKNISDECPFDVITGPDVQFRNFDFVLDTSKLYVKHVYMKSEPSKIDADFYYS